MAKEFVGDRVTMEVREVIEHYGDIIVRAKYDGDYEKTNLPDELIMSSYFALRDRKIVSLTVSSTNRHRIDRNPHADAPLRSGAARSPKAQ